MGCLLPLHLQVGRTSRAGKAGQSLLLLADFEAGFLNKLQSLPIRTLGALSPATVQADGAALTAALAKVCWGCGVACGVVPSAHPLHCHRHAERAPMPNVSLHRVQVSADTKGKAYAAWLGFYKSAPGLSMSVGQLVDTANHFSRIIGTLESKDSAHRNAYRGQHCSTWHKLLQQERHMLS